MGDKVDVKPCKKVESPHPCDPPDACDPNFIGVDCPMPYICREKLKNPAWDGEISKGLSLSTPALVQREAEKPRMITRCIPGAFMHVKACKKIEPPHPCDKKPPCSLKSIYERAKKLPCIVPPLCLERIKNPEYIKKEDISCDESK